MQDGEEVRPGRTGRWLVAALVAVAVLVLLPFLIGFAAFLRPDRNADYPLGGAPEKVPCAEALDFGGAKLPVGAHDTDCTVQAWMDTFYAARFLMPRADVRGWLTRTYPQAPEPGTEFCGEGADLCLNLDSADRPVPDGVGANAVKVDVVYEDAGTALVRFSAFTV